MAVINYENNLTFFALINEQILAGNTIGVYGTVYSEQIRTIKE